MENKLNGKKLNELQKEMEKAFNDGDMIMFGLYKREIKRFYLMFNK